jgi:DNA-binding CsgD family transcriptional regulator
MAETGEPLSDRELAVLECLVDGSTNREIAQNLHISHNTVKVHLRNIFAKLGVSSRTEATAVALQMGLLSLPGLETTDEDENSHPPPPALVETAEPQTAPTPTAEPALPSRWRTVSLALGGLLILVLILLVALQLIQNSVFGTTGEETPPAPFEERIGDTRWSTSPSLPQPISNMTLAAVGLNLYQIGGEVEAGVVNLVNIYETDTGQWRSGEAKPTAVADATAAVLFGEIFVIGGRLTDGRPTAVVEAYSPANNAWRLITALPKPISGGLALSDGSRLYLFGGWDGENYLADIYSYNPNADVWEPLPSMSVSRAFATGGLLSGAFYVIGGQNEQGELAVCEFFNQETADWSTCPDLNHPRAGAGAAVLANNFLYVIGGGIEAQTLDSEVYDLEMDSWLPVETPTLDSQSWHHLAVANIETRIFVFGGRQGEQILDKGYVFSPFVYETFLPAVGANE